MQSGVVDQYIYFVAVDSTNFVTRETALSGFTVYRSRNGGAATAYTTPTVAELSAANMPGVYSLLLDEDMTIDAGDDSQEIVLHITQASMAPVTRTIELYRPIITAGATLTVANGAADADIERIQGTVIATPGVAGILEVDVTHFNNTAGTFAAGRPEVNTSHAAGTAWNSGAIGASTLAADTITAAKIAPDAIGASELAADAVAEIADAVWDEDATAHQTQGTFGQAIGDPGADTDTIWGLVNTNLNATVSSRSSHSAADVWASGTRTLTAGTNIDGSTFTAIPWNAAWDAEVQSEVEDGLIVHRLDELLNADSDIDGVAPPTVGSVFHELLTKTAGSFTYDQTTDSLEAIRDRGDAAWTTAVGFSTLTEANVRTAVGLAAANLDTQLSAIDDFIDTEIADIQARLPAALVGGRMDASVGAMAANVMTAAAAAADLTTELQTGLATAAALTTAQTDISAILVDTGTTLDGLVTAIKAKTDSLTFTQAGQVDANIQYVNDVLVTGNGQSGTEWGP